MPGYIDAPIQASADQIIADALDDLAALAPGWVAREGHLEVWMLEVIGRMNAETQTVATSVPVSIFRYYGKSLIGLPAVDAVSATAPTTWTMVDNAGYTIDAGTVVAFRTAGDTLVPFEVVADVVVPPGALATADGGVIVRALEPGEAGNGLGPAGLELVTSLSNVANGGVVATAASAGGIDAETDDAYLDRLREELQLLAPRPILATDFAVVARRVAGVYRALGLDGYDPAAGTYNHDRTVTVALVDENGAAVAAPVKAAVVALLESEREVNFVVHTMDPTFTNVGTAFTITVRDGYVPADVLASAVAAVNAFVNPATWGGGDEQPPEWFLKTTVFRGEVYQVIYDVPGVKAVTALTLNGGVVDVALAGAAPLPANTGVVGTLA
jgi:hypothetical protein